MSPNFRFRNTYTFKGHAFFRLHSLFIFLFALFLNTPALGHNSQETCFFIFFSLRSIFIHISPFSSSAFAVFRSYQSFLTLLCFSPLFILLPFCHLAEPLKKFVSMPATPFFLSPPMCSFDQIPNNAMMTGREIIVKCRSVLQYSMPKKITVLHLIG